MPKVGLQSFSLLLGVLTNTARLSLMADLTNFLLQMSMVAIASGDCKLQSNNVNDATRRNMIKLRKFFVSFCMYSTPFTIATDVCEVHTSSGSRRACFLSVYLARLWHAQRHLTGTYSQAHEFFRIILLKNNIFTRKGKEEAIRSSVVRFRLYSETYHAMHKKSGLQGEKY